MVRHLNEHRPPQRLPMPRSYRIEALPPYFRPSSHDVIWPFGRHPGTAKFRQLIKEYGPLFLAAGERRTRSRIITDIARATEPGRFLEVHRHGGVDRWFAVTPKEEKIYQALCRFGRRRYEEHHSRPRGSPYTEDSESRQMSVTEENPTHGGDRQDVPHPAHFSRRRARGLVHPNAVKAEFSRQNSWSTGATLTPSPVEHSTKPGAAHRQNCEKDANPGCSTDESDDEKIQHNNEDENRQRKVDNKKSQRKEPGSPKVDHCKEPPNAQGPKASRSAERENGSENIEIEFQSKAPAPRVRSPEESSCGDRKVHAKAAPCPDSERLTTAARDAQDQDDQQSPSEGGAAAKDPDCASESSGSGSEKTVEEAPQAAQDQVAEEVTDEERKLARCCATWDATQQRQRKRSSKPAKTDRPSSPKRKRVRRSAAEISAANERLASESARKLLVSEQNQHHGTAITQEARRRSSSELPPEKREGKGSAQGHDIDAALVQAYLGDPDAQCRVGHFFKLGLGVEKDLKLAAAWYGKAAVQGHADAQLGFGDCYHLGEGVDQNFAIAVQWYEKAAAQYYVKVYKGKVDASRVQADCKMLMGTPSLQDIANERQAIQARLAPANAFPAHHVAGSPAAAGVPRVDDFETMLMAEEAQMPLHPTQNPTVAAQMPQQATLVVTQPAACLPAARPADTERTRKVRFQP